MEKKINSFSMGFQNLKAQKYRTGFMIFFVVVMSMTFFFSTILMKNMAMGIRNTTDRMGANMIIVPEEDTEGIRESLFAGKPVSIFFDKGWDQVIREIDGVNRSTPQLYIATLSASCCDSSAQLIAFDPETDFVVTPWLQSTNKLKLEKGEVVVGADLQTEVGKKIRFYETEFDVVGKLDRTGMGYDNSVFMTFETAYELKDSQKAQENLPTDKLDNAISMIFVDLKSDVKGDKMVQFRSDIRNVKGPDDIRLRTFTADDLMSGISEQVKRLSGYGSIITYIMVVSLALALICIFFVTINERKYEFGILYTLGAKNRQISKIILSEAMLISLAGGILGVAISWYLLYIFRETISIKMDIPFLDVSFMGALPTALLCIGIAAVTGILATIAASYKISKGEPYRLIRESE